MMTRQLRQLALYVLLIVLGCAYGIACASVTNQASASYADAARGNGTLQSNQVTAMQGESITYFTGSDYRTAAQVRLAGQPLYVQASAPACNNDPAVAETIVIAIHSTLGHDTESYSATETGPDTGIFHITGSLVASQVGDEAPREEDGALEIKKNDTLTATIKSCGTGTSTASILIDPTGVVFDSKTGVPVGGARVTLIDVTGAGNGGLAGGAATVFETDGVTAAPSSVVTDADGVYRFPLVPPSLYHVTIVPPSNYSFPSRVALADLPGEHDVYASYSYGGDFVVSASTGAVMLDLPLDPVPGALYLEKAASRATAEVGDFVDYTLRVHNTAEQALVGVEVEDRLPAGFSLVPGSVRLGGVQAADPDGTRGPALRFAIGSLASASDAVLRYRVRIGAGALQGDGINRARATSAAPLALSSGTAAAKVKVSAGVFSEKAFIEGTVFADCDGNRRRDAGEPGVPGVRVYLEDGSFAQTDADGRYSFAEVRPRTHVAKVDGATLPQGAALAALSNRNGGDAASRFVDVHEGELAKADFALHACSPALREAIAARRAAAKDMENSAAKALERPAAAAATASAKAASQADLESLDNSLAFVGLDDGAVLARAVATVRVKGGAGVTFTLAVNGKPVPEARIGKRSTVAAKQLESWEFVGVAFEAGANVLEVSQRDGFGNPRGSRRITVVAPGALARIRLAFDKPGVAADGKSLAMLRVDLEDAAGVPVMERTALTLEAGRGEWQQADLDPHQPGLQLFVEGGHAELALRAPQEPGEAAIRASSGAVQAAGRVDFVPDLRPLVAAGVVEGAVSLNRIAGNVGNPARGFAGFEDQLRHFSTSDGPNAVQVGAHAAMFAKGKVGDDILLTAAYDSDKVVEQKLFRDLDPTAFYPTAGDNAQRGFDAQSTSRLYLRADRNKSWLLFGDMTPPGVTPARNLGAYNRALNGLRHHYEEGGLSVDSFASHDSTRQMVEEIPANGTSGPYLTGSGVMVINSERIEIMVRDRNRPGVLLSSRVLARYADYDIEPLTGRILLRAPVPSLDADLNPITIRISYEIDQGSPEFWVAGSAVQYRIGKLAEVGASYVDDRNPAAPTTLASVNATVRPDDNTSITVEAAHMDKQHADGRAARIDATRKDGKLESHVYAGRAGVDFDNPAASLPKGRAEAGARVVYRADERISFGGEIIHSADLVTGASRDGGQLNAAYAFGNGIRVEGGVRRAHEEAGNASTVLAQPDLTSVRAKLAAQVPNLPQAGVFVEAEQDIHDNGRRMVALGGDYRLAGGSRLYGRHELISSLGSNYALNDGQQRNATVFGVDTDYMKDGRMFSEYRARAAGSDGRQAEAAIGLRNLWSVARGVRLNTAFERVKVLAGAAANEAVALAAGVEVARSPDWKANMRLELRHAVDSDSLLHTLGLAYRLSESWSLLGKNTLAATRSRANDSLRLNELLQSGVAYRALESLGWNGLAKYEYKVERDTGIANLERAVHSIGVTANWQPLRETLLSARYAAKLAHDRSGGYDTRSKAQLLAARLVQELRGGWDVGASVRALVDGGTRGRQFGAGLEAGYQLRKNTWISAGYNLLGFREPDLAGADATARGAYVRLRMKFDERLLEGLLPTAAAKQ
ncbi:DUF11 domain-containing protein [Massilia forsythiae]|uniref:DUF11 domain-containing protein n=1 Tax=Massilia forsythiae TaxID=2728020 RepID=A0A7Z2VYR4_9BURK|nr:DUF11 domain-containing protein [Massilia forsythiae]QJE01913.1 DUF11 domain-containing protein [Massilia forsythiae]